MPNPTARCTEAEAYCLIYVQARPRWEPLREATQIKGDGETHPFLSPDDEFADYETRDVGGLDVPEARTEDMPADIEEDNFFGKHSGADPIGANSAAMNGIMAAVLGRPDADHETPRRNSPVPDISVGEAF